MSVLVIDVGTSSIRVVRADADGSLRNERRAEALPITPMEGLVEFDAAHLAETAARLVSESLAADGPVEGLAITNQRASTVVWDPATGEPVAPGQGWQDLRTVGDCLVLAGEGLRFAPNQSATKVANLLDATDPGRTRGLLGGTIDTWLAWKLSGGSVFVTDASNASVTGLSDEAVTGWAGEVLATLNVPAAMLPTIVDSMGHLGTLHDVAGSPPLLAILGDQQASMIGQGAVLPDTAKITFGTGAMLDVCTPGDHPSVPRTAAGCFPLVGWSEDGARTWAMEAIGLSAGSNVEWMRDDLGIIDHVSDCDALAATIEDADGVVFVPAPLGLGTPHWDYGARSGLFGLTRGSTKAHVARAVLEGVARRGAELLAAAESDTGAHIARLRVDGGMSANGTFVQALANAIQRPVEVSPHLEATARGAALAAGVALGWFPSMAALAELWQPAAVIEPTGSFDADEWASAVERTRNWHADLSAIEF
jgi:glycerol kinase